MLNFEELPRTPLEYYRFLLFELYEEGSFEGIPER